MIIGGVHHSMDDPPPTQSTMFVRAGGRKTNVKKTGSSNDSSPQTNQATRVPSFKASPGKNNLKCYKQLSDLNNKGF